MNKLLIKKYKEIKQRYDSNINALNSYNHEEEKAPTNEEIIERSAELHLRSEQMGRKTSINEISAFLNEIKTHLKNGDSISFVAYNDNGKEHKYKVVDGEFEIKDKPIAKDMYASFDLCDRYVKVPLVDGLRVKIV